MPPFFASVDSLTNLSLTALIFAEKAAEEGIVLLKNENILPISLSASVALLGIGADKTVKGGIGSGDVNNRQNITIYEGMEESIQSIYHAGGAYCF